ncbi:hypothetical protein UA08_04906 [Talaromyces atroroseus]|uniref:Enoyl reductase (ER) domain-containing protein n=1 Tax=Talaromyces atroroseus TaxID=1441469 RepID=A0A225B0A1_TALAT|nr:hypothetical protein UA08_04906 [Talaromyces atroroseus]OKL60155.1 hypothetical protein UA08_04906 [Talaromyces atroroseus]
MSHITNNRAAFITGKGIRPLEVGPGPVPNPAKNEVVIKVAYVAINPVDAITQDKPSVELSYPTPIGEDVSGTVVALGSDVTQFTLGQRVTGHCDGLLSRKPTNMAFQLYATCLEVLVSSIPDSVPLVNAAVLPLAVSTASTGLFSVLKLPFPTISPEPTGRTVLIWGGSSSVGSCAIQLALAAGFNVAATASAKNHEYVRSLGAQHVFDYNDADVVDKVTAFLKEGDLVFDCIGTQDVMGACGGILSKIGGGKLPTVRYPEPSTYDNVTNSFVMGLTPGLVDTSIGVAVWHKYLPEALKGGKFQAKPEPFVIEGGLEKIQEGIDMIKKGVSATKIVVEIAKSA